MLLNHRSGHAEQTYFWFSMQEFSMVGGYMEDLKKQQNCQNLGAWVGMGTCQIQYGTRYLQRLLSQ